MAGFLQLIDGALPTTGQKAATGQTLRASEVEDVFGIELTEHRPRKSPNRSPRKQPAPIANRRNAFQKQFVAAQKRSVQRWRPLPGRRRAAGRGKRNSQRR